MSSVFERRRAEACLSDLTIDRFLARDLPPDEAAGAEAHAVACSRCTERLAEVRGEKERFPVDGWKAPMRRPLPFLRAALALAAGIAIAIVVLPSADRTEDLRTKGAP